MKILLVSGALAPMRCGVGDYTLKLAEALAKSPGADVGILTSIAGRWTSASVTTFPIIDRWALSEGGAVLKLLREWRPDVVHIQYPTQGYGRGYLADAIPLLARLSGCRAVRTWHEVPRMRQLHRFLVQSTPPGPYLVVRPNFLESAPPVVRLLLRLGKHHFLAGASSIPKTRLSSDERAQHRERLVKGQRRLITFFGFVYPFKGVDLLFDIADPATDHLLIAGEAGADREYFRQIEERASRDDWRGKVTITGFQPETEIAAMLAASDAVLLPFRHGGGVWNSSIHAAVMQGTPVVTTSPETRGFDEKRSIYFAAPGDVTAMRDGLRRLAGHRRAMDPQVDRDEWERIADKHLAMYETGQLDSPCFTGRPQALL